MATTIVYEPQYQLLGWCDDGGLTMASWFDRDLAGTYITLAVIYPAFFANPNTFFVPTPPLEYQTFPAFFANVNVFFQPMSVRTLGPPDQSLKNEIRRVR